MRWSTHGTLALARAIGRQPRYTWEGQTRAQHVAMARCYEARAHAATDVANARRAMADAAIEWRAAHEPLRAADAWLRGGEPAYAVAVWQEDMLADRAQKEAVAFARRLQLRDERPLAAQLLSYIHRDDLVAAVCRRVIAPYRLDDDLAIRLELEHDPDTDVMSYAVVTLLDPRNRFRRLRHEGEGRHALAVALQGLVDWLRDAEQGLKDLEEALPGWALYGDTPLPRWGPLGRWQVEAVQARTELRLLGTGVTPRAAYADLKRRVQASP